MGEKWYEARADGVRMRQLQAPYGQFWWGSHPDTGSQRGMRLETAQFFDAFCNISERPGYSLEPHRPRPTTRMIWHPLSETLPWEYGIFWWARYFFDVQLEQKNNVYTHCDAGLFRSPLLMAGWLMTRGHTIGEAANIVWNGGSLHGEAAVDGERHLRDEIQYGFLPADLQEAFANWPCPSLETLVREKPERKTQSL